MLKNTIICFITILFTPNSDLHEMSVLFVYQSNIKLAYKLILGKKEKYALDHCVCFLD